MSSYIHISVKKITFLTLIKITIKCFFLPLNLRNLLLYINSVINTKFSICQVTQSICDKPNRFFSSKLHMKHLCRVFLSIYSVNDQRDYSTIATMQNDSVLSRLVDRIHFFPRRRISIRSTLR